MLGSGGQNRDLLLGRKTYEVFEAHWPYQLTDDLTAISLNVAKKYVALRTLTKLLWNNSSLLNR
jgi:dihydrofolate reductase